MKKRSGHNPKDYKQILIRIPVEYLEIMRWENEKCAGKYPVNDQVRLAIRGMLCGLMYINLLKQ